MLSCFPKFSQFVNLIFPQCLINLNHWQKHEQVSAEPERIKFNNYHELNVRRGGTKHTRIGRRMLYNMWQVEIDTLDLGIFRRYCLHSVSQATTNINQLFQVLETIVFLKHISIYNSGLVVHCCVEYLIEPRVQAIVLEGMYSMDSVKRNSSFKNCIF